MNIAGVNLPLNKKLPYGLRYIYGIGAYIANEICDSLKLDKNKRIKDLTEQEAGLIRKFIDENYKTETDLKVEKQSNIQKLISIRCFKGLRHKANLPTRGQRTHTNAKTRKRVRL